MHDPHGRAPLGEADRRFHPPEIRDHPVHLKESPLTHRAQGGFCYIPVQGASSPVARRKKSHRSGRGHPPSTDRGEPNCPPCLKGEKRPPGAGGILFISPSKGHPLPSRGEKKPPLRARTPLVRGQRGEGDGNA